MPGVYREKTCPRCDKIHRRRGPYCSRECGNIREFTPDQREEITKKIKEGNAEHQRTPEAIAQNKLKSHLNKLGLESVASENFAIEIPDIPDRHSMPFDIDRYDDATDW